MLQDETDPLDVGQVAEGRRELITEVMLRAPPLRRVVVVRDVDLERLEAPGTLLAQELQCGVDRDPMYPGLEARVAVELVALVPGLQQPVLHGVLGQLAAARDAQAGGEPSC